MTHAPIFTLGAPGPDLAIEPGTFSHVQWLPPAAGTLSLYVSTSPRPAGLAALRKLDGTPAFADNKLIVLFRLLPEVEDRLHRLLRALANPDGTPNSLGRPTRSRVRWFALELPATDPSLDDVESCIQPAMPTTLTVPAARANYLGFMLNSDAVASAPLRNGPSAMADLKRPGDFLGSDEYLWRFSTNTSGVKLWTFDSGGRPIDPGAVAEWWRFIADVETLKSLYASGDPARQFTMPVDPVKTVHFVNAHEGPLALTDPIFLRLQVTGAAGIGVLRTQSSPTLPVQVGLQPPASTVNDAAPIPRIAVLPNGVYNPLGVRLFIQNPDPTTPLLMRDFIRIAAMDVERHLTGQSRVPTGAPGSGTALRADDQERESTRIRVERTSTPALLPSTDIAAAAITAVAAGPGQFRLVSSVLERDWTGLEQLPDLPNVAPATKIDGITVRALAGGGVEESGTIANQRVLVEINLPSNHVGAWLRVWPQTLDHETARHIRLDGGSGQASNNGSGARASIVVKLADGSVDPEALMGVDVMIVTARGARLIADQRFARPTPVAAPAVAFSAITGNVLVCETGQLVAPSSLRDVRSGSHLVVLDPQPALIDRTTIPMSAFTSDVMIRNLVAGDIVELTQPAFVGTPEGDLPSTFAASGATVNRRIREGLLRSLVMPSSPLPTLERLEIAGAAVDPTGANAALAGTPALGRYHELFPHRLGHPGAPGAVDIHGTGVRLTHRAAVALADLVRDRPSPSTLDLATVSSTPFIEHAPPLSPGVWAAPLKTVSVGIEGEAILLQALSLSDVYPFGSTLQDVINWFNTNVAITIPAPATTAAASVARALDRRVLASAKGAREAAISLQRAFSDAQDLVYIETPALDALTIGPTDDSTEVISKLIARLGDNRSLCVVLCVPIHPMPGAPRGYKRVRDQMMLNAIETLRSVAGPRIAVFSPSAGPGRTLRLASTTVIVDDVYALTGTTHLSRRGLSFDSSLAAAVFDEVLDDGRPAEVRQFRRRLVAERLGLTQSLVPDDPTDLVAAIKRAVKRGSGRVAPFMLPPAELPVTEIDKDAWNRDGAVIPPDLNLLGWIVGNIVTEVQSSVNPPPDQ